MKNFYFILILQFLSFFSQAQTNVCSGSYTTGSRVCQAILIGNGTPGQIRICISTNNIPSGGGTSCNPGTGCNPPYSGGGWSPRIAIYESNGTGSTGASLENWTSATAVGTCFTVSSTNGYAYIYGLCLTAGTVITWSTVNACGSQVCTGTPPPCTGPVCTSCATACSACGFTSNPTVNQVTSSCPDYPFNPPLPTGQTATRCGSFTAINSTVNFNVIISSNCGSGNVSSFSWTLQQAGCGSVIQSGTLSSLTFTGLTVGQQYVYCYTFTVPNPGPPTGSCTHTTHYPYFVGAAQLLASDLLSFTVKKENRKNLVEWIKTTKDADFTIERSVDGIAFEGIGEKTSDEGIVNTENNILYRFHDNTPIPEAYYRIKSIDKMDGFIEYSNIKYLSRNDVENLETFSIVSMYPIPNIGDTEINIEIQSNEVQITNFKIYNSSGILVKNFKQILNKGLNTVPILTDSLPKGIYTILVDCDKINLIKRKFVKI